MQLQQLIHIALLAMASALPEAQAASDKRSTSLRRSSPVGDAFIPWFGLPSPDVENEYCKGKTSKGVPKKFSVVCDPFSNDDDITSNVCTSCCTCSAFGAMECVSNRDSQPCKDHTVNDLENACFFLEENCGCVLSTSL